MTITILDPALCCSTGVCGPDVNDSLLQTAANVKWLKSMGVVVLRHGISNDGEAFYHYPEAIEKLKSDGLYSLPYILRNGKIVMQGRYPDKAEWEQLLLGDSTEVIETSNSSCCGGSSCC